MSRIEIFGSWFIPLRLMLLEIKIVMKELLVPFG